MPHFKLENIRVPKIDDPLLIIGLGGTGADAVVNIKRKFKERFVLPKIGDEVQDKPARTAYLAIDTDQQELARRSAGSVGLQTSERFALDMPNLDSLISNPAAMMEWEKRWWDKRVPPRIAENGAGGFRQVGRLLLFRNALSLSERLTAQIGNLMAVDQAETGGSLNIIVAAGISGGTGSGTFLDFAYLLRHIMRTKFLGVRFRIQAYIVMPGVNLAKMDNPSDTDRSMLKMNAFAALKELDFWMNWEQHKYVHKQKYAENIDTTWDCAPFNDVVLMSEGKEDGTVIKNAYSVVMDTLSESLLHYFAAEQSTGDETGFTYLSHLSNVVKASIHMPKTFPVNYTYMSVGAANSEAQQDKMITYEAKLTFDEVMALSDRPGILGSRVADEALSEVMPPEENLFSLFETVHPLPACFNGEPGYEPNEILKMLGEDALHGRPYQSFAREADMDARAFAQERAQKIWERFEKTVRKYLTDPAYGPFVVSQWLKDPENGFIPKFHGFATWWRTQQSNAEMESSNLFNHISNTLYPEMINLNALSKALGLLGKVRSYTAATQQLYVNRRDALLAKYMAEEMATLEKRIADYGNVILPTFCELLKDVSGSLNKDVSDLLRKEGAGNDMITFGTLKTFIDQKMQALTDSGQMNATTIGILQSLADSSFAVSLNQARNIDEWEDKKAMFLGITEKFVNELTRDINSVSMDSILEMTMPQTTETQKVDYLVNTMMPRLKNAAKTMLKLIAREPEEKVVYSYVSVPDNASIVKQGLSQYGELNKITPKYSKITDRIYWLMTYNCLALYRYADLRDLELVYEQSLEELKNLGVHLVQTQDPTLTSSIHHNWQHLPSPIPHVLLGEMDAPRGKRLVQQQKELYRILDEALKTRYAALQNDGIQDTLVVNVKYNPDGTIMDMSVIKKEVDQILTNNQTSGKEKQEALEKLRTQGNPLYLNCRNYASAFANALGLKVTPLDGSETEQKRAAEEMRKARWEAVKYFMISQHPDVVETMGRQIEIFRYIDDEIKKLAGVDEVWNQFADYVKPFMHLYVFDVLKWGRQSVEFLNVSQQYIPLVSNNVLTDEEVTLLGYCKPLVALKMLAEENDERINPNDRRYLKVKAQQLMDSINDISDEEYQAAQKKAAAFAQEFNNATNELLFNRGEMSKNIREHNADLINKMVRETRIFK